MHPAAFDYVARFATDAPISIVEVGGRDVNGTTRVLFPAATWWAIDAQPGDGVNEVADGATWSHPTGVDLVVCTEVFEHTPRWRRIVSNIATSILRPGGRVVLTMAGPGRAPHGLHADDPDQPGWYANITTDELAEALTAAGFVDVDVEQADDDTRGTALRP